MVEEIAFCATPTDGTRSVNCIGRSNSTRIQICHQPKFAIFKVLSTNQRFDLLEFRRHELGFEPGRIAEWVREKD